MNVAQRIILTPQERAALDQWIEGASPARLIQRAKIIRLSAEGIFSHEIALKLHVSRPTVQLWRERFIAQRLKGLEKDAPRCGRKPIIRPQIVEAIVAAAPRPQRPGTPVSLRSLGRAYGVSKDSVRRIWQKHGAQEHPAAQRLDIAGVYLNPPEKALVLCLGSVNASAAGTASTALPGHAAAALGGALRLLEADVTGDDLARFRPHEFIRFLKSLEVKVPAGYKLLVISGGGMHQDQRVKAWIKRHPRFELAGTMDAGTVVPQSLLSEAGPGSLGRTAKLVRAMMDYMETAHQKPGIFVWTDS